MYTCCPHCKTCFRITKPQLAVAQGKVRCGTCSQIFNAREHLYETLPERKPTPGRPPPAAGRPAPATATPPSPAPSSNSPEPPRSRPDDTPAAPTPATGVDNGPDLDLFNFAHAPAEPDTSGDEPDDVFLEAREEEEDTAVIDVSDWDDLDLETVTTETPETVPEEFHAPVHEPLTSPADEEDEEIDLFDEEEEEDTAVIDLSDAPDPFAPHAGVPLGQTNADEDEEDEFPFDEEDEEEDITAVIDVSDERDRLAGIPGLDEPPAATPLEDESAKEPLVGIPPATASPPDEDASIFAPDEHFVTDDKPAPPEPSVAETDAEVKLPELEDFSFEVETPAETPATEEPPVAPPADADRYTYVDPEELRKEDKHIDEIIAEMNAQLTESIEPPSVSAEDEEKKRDTATPRPGGDDFESSFLANLDEVLTKPLPETPDSAESPKPAGAGKSPVKPAEVLDIINPADNLNQGMVPDDAIPLPLREELVTEGTTGSPMKFGLQILLILALTATLGIQLAIFRSTEIANALPSLRPLLELVCQRVECRYNGPIDVDRIQLVSRDIRDHPARPDALLIKATLVNKAPFAQPFPDMEITLSDLTGAVVARRRFHPREYLGSYWHPFLLMRPDQPVQVTLEVLNPGQDAVNFEFAFRPATGG
ncbi:MAG TPA: DUF3426 domain-containing protein [Gammaproteobacteria bacterium]|nr:DUF3426 domain-containing protein [Gammaproteobacteria bacterium]